MSGIEKFAPKIAERDKRAFEELYGVLSRVVYSVCLGIVRDRSVSEELTQDVFVSVWENIGDYKGNGFKTWIIATARNRALNALRSKRHEMPVDFSENESVCGEYETDERADVRSVLDSALRILRDDERQIVLMRNAGLKAKEIAAALGMPRGTVSWKYAEAIERMRKYLEEEQ